MRTVEEIKGKLELAQKEDSADGVAAWTIELFKTITDSISPDRLEEICNAERDGRCVVLPCKVGDTVYDLAFGGYAFEITRIEMHMNNRMWFRCGNKGTDDYMAFSLDDIGERVSFIKPKPQPSIPAEAALKECE